VVGRRRTGQPRAVPSVARPRQLHAQTNRPTLNPYSTLVKAYSRREVAWLLSLKEHEARQHDECLPSCAVTWGKTDASTNEGTPLPTYLRWLDVQRARSAALATMSAEHDLVTQLRVNCHTEQGIATLVGTSDSTVRRRFTSTLDAIMLALGGEIVEDEAQPHIPLCLTCGQRPRARAVTFGAKRRGQPRPRHERQLATCRECATAAAARTGTDPPRFTTLIEKDAA
jgi:hypothetical protein